jgi:hypothetical protein
MWLDDDKELALITGEVESRRFADEPGDLDKPGEVNEIAMNKPTEEQEFVEMNENEGDDSRWTTLVEWTVLMQ